MTVDLDSILQKNLDCFVSANTLRFFGIFYLDSKFTELDPGLWLSDGNCNVTEKCIGSINYCINDTAKHGVVLIEEYNQLHTQDETQKQFLLQIVGDHWRSCADFATTLPQTI
ncbi:hypothetical protein ANN_02345 [Periplaneta americana]|uniref:Uncharacterized protein n=1 Tax=Periplaneta americana TaxID=6978 RepID=A0ABQ8TW09_PERAM|nr:hypothetical protein ANN_02345 [Periplaneta americana]